MKDLEKRVKKSQVLQLSNKDCGGACLATVVRFFGGEVSVEYVRRLAGTTREGTTVLGLFQAAKKIGLVPSAMKANQIKNLRDLDSPAILHVVMDDSRNHYISYFGFKDNQYLIADPGREVSWVDEKFLENIWTSRALVALKPNEDFEYSKKLTERKAKWLFGMIKEDLPILAIMAFLGLIMTVLGLSVSVFSQKLIDEILPESDFQRLIVGLVLVFVLLSARSATAYIRSKIAVKQSTEFNSKIVFDFYSRLMNLRKEFFDTRKTGEFVSRLNDTQRIQRAVTHFAGELSVDLLLIIVTAFAVFSYSMEMGFLLLIFIPLYFSLVYIYSKRLSKRQKSVMKAFAMTESNYIDTIQGISSIKNFGKEKNLTNLNNNIYLNYQNQVYSLGLLGAGMGLSSNLLGVVYMVAIITAASYMVLIESLMLGEMVALIAFFGMIIPAVNKLAMSNVQIQEAKIAFDRMFEFGFAEKEDLETVKEELGTVESLKLIDVSFRFTGRKSLLNTINLELKKGRLTCILGESGGGKSTLLQLILRFYELESGKILANDILDINESNLGTWRSSIGYVEQETKIFNGTLLQNICFFDSKTNIKMVTDFCEKFGLMKFFDKLPAGFHTVIGEEGINLSGGQKQLVSFARTLYHNPKVLILDEFTGAMDKETENFMLDLLENLKKKMPILIVTHKISLALRSDYIYILEDGEITHAGSPKLLLKSGNLLSKSFEEISHWFKKNEI